MLADRLGALDVAAPLDRVALLDCARTGAELARVRDRLTESADGLGRARFGFVASSSGALAELLAWPRHPWFAPGVVLTDPSRLASVAAGLAEAMLRDHLDTVRLLRRAELLAKPPANLPARLAALAQLAWGSLTDAEQADCPPLLVLVDGTAPQLDELLRPDLPLKVLRLVVSPRPGVLPPNTFALRSSVGAPDHLLAGFLAALACPGGAWVEVHAPEPLVGGFEADQTLAVARAALEDGSWDLALRDPRQGDAAPAEPDVEALRQELREELQANQAAAVQAEVARAREAADGEGLERLTERLMGLAGYPVGEG